MLRKSSRHKLRQIEQERLAQEKASRSRGPPQLPVPDISSLHVNGSDHFSQSVPSSTSTTFNFSRPSPESGNTRILSSSSPGHSWRDNVGSSPSGPARTTYELYARTESMTHRGRYSYASSVGGIHSDTPRRVRRRKDPTPFNVLVVGAKNAGKTSFISFLRHSLSRLDSKSVIEDEVDPGRDVTNSFESHYLETEIDGERVGLTLWDSAGLEKGVVDLQLREMTAFVESKFEDTFLEEQKVMRSPGVQDTHIHCVFLILDPARLDNNLTESARCGEAASLDENLDLQVIRALWGKTTVIPIISKADTLTTKHMALLKRSVSEKLKRCKLDPLEAFEFEDDEDEQHEDATDDDDNTHSTDLPTVQPRAVASKPRQTSHQRQQSIPSNVSKGTHSSDETPYLPMSILSPDPHELASIGSDDEIHERVGRHFPWGFADPYDPKHCDFTRLKESIFVEWRGDLRDLARVKWYENWRTSRLRTRSSNRQGARTSSRKAVPSSPPTGAPTGSQPGELAALRNGTTGLPNGAGER